MKRGFVITHTVASHHRADLVGGWFDSELTELGIEQAQLTATTLAAMIGDDRG